MAEEETRTVLFADVSGSTQLYESAGDEAAAQAIAQCMGVLRLVTEAAGGEVMKEIGDELMATFADADSAANAATRMHVAIDGLPLVGSRKLGVRIGFQAGPVMRRGDDLFGEAVNLASALVEQAAKGQVLTSAETAERLSPAVRSCTRALYSVPLKGSSESISLYELVWRQGPDITDVAGSVLTSSAGRLWLKYRGTEIQGWEPTLNVGRDKECHVVVTSENASRQHCTIERRGEKFVLCDFSTNGTYVSVEGEAELVLHREEYILRGHGWITCGEPHSQAADPLEYYCE
jgi:adenylate cyclase